MAVWAATALSASAQLPAGSLDPSYPAASAQISLSPTDAHLPTDVVVAPDSTVFLTGTLTGANVFPVVTKLRADGTVDTTYGSNGTAVLERYTNSASGHAIAPMADGTVVVVSTRGFLLVAKRLKATGAQDPTFGTQGESRFSLVGGFVIHQFLVEPDGKLLVVCTAPSITPGFTSTLYLARMNADGTADRTFGITGLVSVNNTLSLQAATVQRLPDGRLLTSASTKSLTATPESFLRLQQFQSDGSIDSTFGIGGTIESDPLPLAAVSAMQLDSKGATLMLGPTPPTFGQPPGFTLLRMDASGEADTTFAGNDGIESYSGSDSSGPRLLTGLKLLERADGRIFVSGSASTTSPGVLDGFLMRIQPDGLRDAAFGTNGLIFHQLGFSTSILRSMALQGDGNLLIAVSSRVSNVQHFNAYGVQRFIAGDLIANTVPQITQFLSNPPGLAVQQFQPVTITAQVAPNALAPWFRWRHQGALLPAFTGPALTIPFTTWLNDGDYTLEVGNFAGSAIFPFALTVHAPPVITTPVDYALQSTQAVFSVTVAGRPPFSYQWQRGGVVYDVPHVSSQFTDTLILPRHPGYAGDYRVVVTNAQGTTTSDPVFFTPPPEHPIVIEEPQPIEALSDGPVTFQVKVMGRTPMTFQWQKDGVNLGAPVVRIADAGQQNITTDTLFVHAIPPNAGAYRCIVTSALGWAVTREASLIIWTKSTIRQDHPLLILRAGEPLDLTTRIFDVSTPNQRRFQWLRGGRALTGARSDVFHVPAVSFAHAGVYQLVMTTPQGRTASQTATVAVVDPLDKRVVVTAGKTATLTVQTAGPGLYYNWRRADGTLLTGPRYSGVHTRTLKIAQTNTTTDTGDYRCEVLWSQFYGTPALSGRTTLLVESTPPVVETLALPPSEQGHNYLAALNASHSPTKFTVTGLPRGLVCNTATGLITGVPSVTGIFTINVVATNPVGKSAPKTLPLIVAAQSGAIATHFAGPLGATDLPDGQVQLTVTSTGQFSGKLGFGVASKAFTTVAFMGKLKANADGTWENISLPISLSTDAEPAQLSLSLNAGQNSLAATLAIASNH